MRPIGCLLMLLGIAGLLTGIFFLPGAIVCGLGLLFFVVGQSGINQAAHRKHLRRVEKMQKQALELEQQRQWAQQRQWEQQQAAPYHVPPPVPNAAGSFATCPGCQLQIVHDGSRIGQVIACGRCGQQFQLI